MMDVGLLRETVLVLALIAFCGIVWWAYAPSRRRRFERDALSVFDDESSDAATRAELVAVSARRKGV
jgi:cytochrome c oxidase cbb3-type subunit 4